MGWSENVNQHVVHLKRHKKEKTYIVNISAIFKCFSPIILCSNPWSRDGTAKGRIVQLFRLLTLLDLWVFYFLSDIKTLGTTRWHADTQYQVLKITFSILNISLPSYSTTKI